MRRNFDRAERRDIHQEVTDRIIQALESGALPPWVQPWHSMGGGVLGQHRNGYSQRPYSGVNVLLCALAAMVNGYTSREWYTFKNVKALGGHVRKNETHSLRIVFFKPQRIRKVDDTTGEVEYRVVPLIRDWAMFNREQCEGLPEEKKADPIAPMVRDQDCEAFIADTGARIQWGGSAAYYSPGADFVSLPHREAFDDSGACYSVAFHELVHWSGHSSRLARLGRDNGGFGSEKYAFEELVAELGSAFLCSEFSVDGTLQHPQYVANWLQVLKNDKKAIFRASHLATQASEFLQHVEASDDDDEQAAA